MKSNLSIHEKINARSNFSFVANRRCKIPYDGRIRYLSVAEIYQPYFPEQSYNKGMRMNKKQLFKAKK